jgi:four helix bundle protein
MDNNHEKQFTFFRFEDLRVYHKSLDYSVWVKETTTSYSDPVNIDLANKFSSAALSISINIAEGSARNKSQFIYYLKMAKSALRECLVYGTLSLNLGFVTSEEELHSRNQLMEMTKMIGALISSLQRSVVKVEEETEFEHEHDFDANTY